MRIALISDLHGNEVALDATLADIRLAGADRIVCLGDVATLGPHPHAVLDRLRDLGCPCILGNHDEFMLDETLIHTYTEAQVVVEAVEWCRARLRPRDFEFIGGFLDHLEVPLDGAGTLFLYHGSPRSNMEDLVSTTPTDEVERMLDGRATAIMAGGHTHIQMLRHHQRTLLVNPGSVGLAFKEYVQGREPQLLPIAEYALVEVKQGAVNVSLRRIPLDLAALRAAASSTNNPLGPFWAREYAR